MGFFWKLFGSVLSLLGSGNPLLSVRFVSNLGRSITRALFSCPPTARSQTESGPFQPSWLGRIPAELFQVPSEAATQLEPARSWPEFSRTFWPAELSPAGVARDSSAPVWWCDLERELELRAGLVSEQWEIRGPGLLAALTRHLDSALPLKPLQIELVLPIHGGSGQYLRGDRAWLEALLHDVSPQFSETLRVGWLVACQACDEPTTARRLLLEAAADVEWLSDDPLTELALQAWLEGASPVAAVRESDPRQEEAGR